MTTDPRGDAIKPQTIHADRPARELQIAWADGHRSVYPFDALRWLCPCAFCRGEAGQPGWLDSNPTLTAEQMELVDISLVGHYAVQPVWADGHSSGFYTFLHLRRNCPCDDEGPAGQGPPQASTPHAHG